MKIAPALLLAYLCLLPIGWSPLPSNVQWCDLLFVALCVATFAARPRLRLTWLDGIVIAYVVSAVPSMIGVPLRDSGVAFAKQAYGAAIYAVVAAQALTIVAPERIARWFAGVAVVVAAVCALAVVAYYAFGLTALRLGVTMPMPYIGHFFRLYGAFPSPEYLVNFLAFAAPIVLVHAMALDRARARLWGVAMAVILVAAVFTAGHGVVGLIAGIVFVAAKAAFRQRPVLVGLAVAATVAAILAINVLLVFAIRQVHVVNGRNTTIAAPAYPYAQHDAIGAPQVDVAVTYNVMAYWLLKEVAWHAFAQHPVAGLGMGAFHRATERAVSDGWLPNEYAHHDPHSTWMGRLAETGAIGAAGLLALWVGVLVRAHRAQHGRDAVLAMALAAASVALLVNSPNVDVMNFRFLWLGFGLVRGLAIGA